MVIKITNRQLKYEYIKEHIASYGANLITPVEDYKDVISKLEIKCSCGMVSFYSTYKDLMRSKDPNKCKCKVCGVNTRRWTYGELLYYISSQTNIKFTTDQKLNTYLKKNDILNLQCPCGEFYSTTLGNLYHRRQHICMECSMDSVSAMYRRDIKDVYNSVADKGYRIIKFIEPYKNTYSKFKVVCPNGHEYITYAQNLVGKDRNCSHCRTVEPSKGESAIKRVLDMGNIKYIEEYQFEDCKNLRPLPFDFFVPEYNTVIEYDGEQHFESIEFFGGDERFEYIKNNDRIKNEYCEDNDIRLLRIPYWDFDNIEEMVTIGLLNYNKGCA